MLFGVAILLGFIIGCGINGFRLPQGGKIRFNGLGLIIFSALLNILGGIGATRGLIPPTWVRLLLNTVVYLAIGVVILLNPQWSRWARILLLSGAFCNFLVIAANGGQMPVNLDLLKQQGRTLLADRIQKGAYRHTPLGPQTRLPFLADVIPLPHPFSVPSIGDLLVAIGLFLLIMDLLRGSKVPSP